MTMCILMALMNVAVMAVIGFNWLNAASMGVCLICAGFIAYLDFL